MENNIEPGTKSDSAENVKLEAAKPVGGIRTTKKSNFGNRYRENPQVFDASWPSCAFRDLWIQGGEFCL